MNCNMPSKWHLFPEKRDNKFSKFIHLNTWSRLRQNHKFFNPKWYFINFIDPYTAQCARGQQCLCCFLNKQFTGKTLYNIVSFTCNSFPVKSTHSISYHADVYQYFTDALFRTLTLTDIIDLHEIKSTICCCQYLVTNHQHRVNSIPHNF